MHSATVKSVSARPAKPEPGRWSVPGAGVWQFETHLGQAAVAWTESGVDWLALPTSPETLERELGARAERPSPKRPPRPIASLGRRVRRHLAGHSDPFDDVPVDLKAVTPFQRQVYAALRRIGPGEVISYGELAALADRPGGAQAVGRAMATNPVPLIIPCHRVLAAAGRLGGFSAAGGVALKARMLVSEGVVLNAEHAAGVRHLRRVEPKLRATIDQATPYLPGLTAPLPPYDALVRAIIYQQLSGKAAATIAARVKALTPGGRFPRPAELGRLRDPELRTAGLSAQKTSYLRDLAARVESGHLNLARLGRLDDDAVVDTVTQVKGIGRWTAHMLLLFHLGRLDVLPVDDLGIQKGVQCLHRCRQRPSPETVARYAESWRPYRSIGSWYMWRILES